MSSNGHHESTPPNYETKFGGFIQMCQKAKKDGVDTIFIANPEALGDDYAEIVESLNRLADAELKLIIVPRSKR